MTNAVAVREDQHPIIAAIDQRMPEIAGILPAGMSGERFRKVVVQAMLRQPTLWNCSPISIITAITEAAEVGIEPTGVLGKGWLIPYRGEAKFIPGWRGFVDLCWRADRILLSVEAVRVGDEFSYRRGTNPYLHHVPAIDDPEREASDDNITATYVVAVFPDGRQDFEVMSRASLDRIRDVALSKIRDEKKRNESPWVQHPGEMMKKTPVRRIAKRLPLSPAVQAMLARDEEIDYDTPVERVPDPKRDGLRDRIAARSAALRGQSSEESEGSVSNGAAGGTNTPVGSQPEGELTSPSGGSSVKGDPWMRRLHALGNERGMDHAALHDWAVQHFRVQSLTDLTPPQRATFMELVEGMDVMPQPEARAHADPAEPPQAVDGAPDSLDRGAPAADSPTLEDVLAATGGELIPPKPRTPEYGALTAPEKAQARAYWSEREAEAKQRPDAEQIKAAIE